MKKARRGTEAETVYGFDFHCERMDFFISIIFAVAARQTAT